MNRPLPNESRRSALVALGSAWLAGATGFSARAETAPAALPVAQIIERHIAARGGAAAWKSVQTLSMSGQLDAGRSSADAAKLIEETRKAPGQPRKRLHPEVQLAEAKPDTTIRLPYLIEFRRPRQMRVELKVKDTTAVQVYDGKQGWKLRPYLGRHEVEPYTASELKLAASQQEIDGPLFNAAAKGTKVEAAGIEDVAGAPAYKLKLTLKSGDLMTVWVDTRTFLDVKLATVRHVAGKERTVATYMRDFRKVNGILLPFQLEDQIEGQRGVQRIDIEQVAVNPKLADSRFTKPA